MSDEQQGLGWFYLDSNQQRQGPYTSEEFKSLIDQKVITLETSVQRRGAIHWYSASEVPEMAAAIRSPEPPPIPDHHTREAVEPTEESVVVEEEIAVEELKPRKGSFMFARIMIGLLSALVLSIIVAVGLYLADMPWVYSGLIFIVGLLLSIFSASVAYRKEQYELGGRSVVCHRGGIVSDQTTELEIRNITHVKVHLPWLRYKLLGIGSVLIESAGNAQPVVLQKILRPEEVYTDIAERMKRNGYALSKKELIHEESPALVGVILESLAIIIAAIFGFVFFVSGWIFPEEDTIPFIPRSVGVIITSVTGLIPFVIAVLRFLDLRRRTYQVFNDTVVYTEGFLTRQNAFIPYENIADAATQRTFMDQILDLYDVMISCQGSSSEIKFRRLRHGPQLSDSIDRLVLEAGNKKAALKAKAQSEGHNKTHQRLRRSEPEMVAPAQAWVADLKMNPARVFLPLMLLLPIVPLWILTMIKSGIKFMATSYSVRPGSLRHSYRFLTTDDREFAYDKITGLVIKENLWDKLFRTVTLKFWSIGSGQSLELAYISKKWIDFDSLKQQVGIPEPSLEPYEVRARCGIFTWIRARCLHLAIAALFVVGIVIAAQQLEKDIILSFTSVPVVLSFIGLISSLIYYRRQRLRFYDHHIEAEQGILTRSRYYACYSNVKKIKTERYPGGHQGDLQIFVAGEQLAGQQAKGTQKQGFKGIPVPNSFTLGFLPEIDDKAQILDDILCGRIDPAPEMTPAESLPLVTESKRRVGNSVLVLLIWSIVIFPLIVLLPLTLPWRILATKKWRYSLDAGRVMANWGILYKKQTSVLLDRIDSLKQEQGPVNKMFQNSNVSIMTAGSSKPDLVLKSALDSQTLYQEIRERSQGS